ncbi:MAG: zf-HC2 domain-containing protein, partial [Candidatus Limnocylindria bacterium]
MSDRCAALRDDLAAFVTEGLDAAASRAVRGHLRRCADCRDAREGYARGWAALAQT